MKFVSNTIQSHIIRQNPENNLFEHLILKRAADIYVYPNIPEYL